MLILIIKDHLIEPELHVLLPHLSQVPYENHVRRFLIGNWREKLFSNQQLGMGVYMKIWL